MKTLKNNDMQRNFIFRAWFYLTEGGYWREDIFDQYTHEDFEKEFKKYFRINSAIKLKDSERVLYIMEKQVD